MFVRSRYWQRRHKVNKKNYCFAYEVHGGKFSDQSTAIKHAYIANWYLQYELAVALLEPNVNCYLLDKGMTYNLCCYMFAEMLNWMRNWDCSFCFSRTQQFYVRKVCREKLDLVVFELSWMWKLQLTTDCLRIQLHQTE